MTIQEKLLMYGRWESASAEYSDDMKAAADRIDALEAALRKISDSVGTLSPHAIRIQVRKALEVSS